MEPNLFKYIWHHSKREQIAILSLVLISLPFYYLSLNLPKNIVNQGIQGSGFEGPGSTQKFLYLELPYDEALFGETVVLLDGIELEQLDFLMALSLVFLVLVIVNGLFKFIINTSKGRMGERMLRRLRYELADRVLRFPIPHLRKVKQAETATMIKDEVEPLGGFIGDAFVSPAFLGGQALTALAFILAQSVWLGLVAVAIIAIQSYLIPKLRVRILELGRERQLTARQLAGRIGELVEGGVVIHAHDTSNLERADVSHRLGHIFRIRYEIFQRKFFVKFLNNFLAQLTPFVFYAGGGVLALRGHLDIGALVAVIAAYKDLPGPIKELIDWDQRRNDVQIKYDQVVMQFQPDGMLDPALQDPEAVGDGKLEGTIRLSNAGILDEAGNGLVEQVSLDIEIGEKIAIVGDSRSGKEHLGILLAGLQSPSVGSVRLNGKDLAELPEALRGRRLSYSDQQAYLFPMSLRENLLYGLKHKPLRRTEKSPDPEKAAFDESESRRTGNTTMDIEADWVDYAAAGVKDAEGLEERIIELLGLMDLESDIYRWGLTGRIDDTRHPEIAAEVLELRALLPEQLAARDAEDLVVNFDADAYNHNASLGENLLFGSAARRDFEPDRLADNEILLDTLKETDLLDRVYRMGLEIARTMVEIFADLPPGHPFFTQYSFIDADQLPAYQALVTRADANGIDALEAVDLIQLRQLPFDYVEARHRLGLIDEEVEKKVILARAKLAEAVEEQAPGAVAFHHAERYNPAASLLDNVLFGRVAYGQAKAEETVTGIVSDLLDTRGLHNMVLAAGLEYEAGLGGQRLSPAQRQKFAMVRALLRKPDLLVLNQALSALDRNSQADLAVRILESLQDQGVIWTLQQVGRVEVFDRVIVMQGGRLVEEGRYEDLNRPGTALHAFLAAE